MSKILAIGDTTDDAFIELESAEIVEKEGQEYIQIKWGDKIPFIDVNIAKAVGNSANASVSFSRLGCPVSILTWLGDDASGKEAIEIFKKENIGTNLIQVQEGKKTNYHYALSYKAERTILIKHEDFNYELQGSDIDKDVEWIYFSSIGQNKSSIEFHQKITEFLENNKNIKLVFQPGTFQMKLGIEKLKKLYENTYLFVCNREEAERILEVSVDDIKVLLNKLKETGVTIPVITDGPDGAYALFEDKYYFIPMYKDPKPPVERTGAGDAFTSTLTSFLSKGYSFKESLKRAPINSMNVVQHIGAQAGLLDEKGIDKWLSVAEKDYEVREI